MTKNHPHEASETIAEVLRILDENITLLCEKYTDNRFLKTVFVEELTEPVMDKVTVDYGEEVANLETRVDTGQINSEEFYQKLDELNEHYNFVCELYGTTRSKKCQYPPIPRNLKPSSGRPRLLRPSSPTTSPSS